MNRKSSIIITQNHSKTGIIKIKHPLVVTFGKLKRRLEIPTLTWLIVRTVPAYSNTMKICALCLHEILEILKYPNTRTSK